MYNFSSLIYSAKIIASSNLVASLLIASAALIALKPDTSISWFKIESKIVTIWWFLFVVLPCPPGLYPIWVADTLLKPSRIKYI